MREVDSFRFTGKMIKKFVLDMIENGREQKSIPWTPRSKKISKSRVSLVTTAGISMETDTPFDMETERKKGDWGDPSWRLIKHGSKIEHLNVNHLHIDTTYIKKDLNVALPIDIIEDFLQKGIVGSISKFHYSIMGYQGSDTSHLINFSGPEIAKSMKQDNVDLAILAPV
ncbi:MAG: hypothetical protein CBC29_08625 [Methylococcaceae bacterium TMED69]|nr:MAG: hypothetical protein CBC29_08625 [Methylococcaceae bacterium TMED69]